MTERQQVVIELVPDGEGRLKAQLAGAERSLDSLGRSAEVTGQRGQRGMGRLAAAVNSVGGRIAVAAAGVLGLSKVLDGLRGSALAAAQVETLDVVLRQVARNANLDADAVQSLVSDVEDLGITSDVARQTLIRMTQAQLDLTQATRLARTAQDAAVVGNTNSSEALDRLLNGVVTLQPELLRTIGITVSLEQEYAKVAKATGRTVNSLTQAEKQQIALNAALREGRRLFGSYEAAMQTVNKQIGSLSREHQTLAEEVGKVFQPVLLATTKAYRQELESMTDVVRGFNAATGATDLSKLSMYELDKEIERVAGELHEFNREASGLIESGNYLGLIRRQLIALPGEKSLLDVAALRAYMAELKTARSAFSQGPDDGLRGAPVSGLSASTDDAEAEAARREALEATAEALREKVLPGYAELAALRRDLAAVDDLQAAGIISAEEADRLADYVENGEAYATQIRERNALMREGADLTAELASAEEVRATTLARIDSLYEAGAINGVTRIKAIQAAEAEYIEASRGFAAEWSDMWATAGNRFAAGIGDAVAEAIMYQKSMGEMLRSLLAGVLRQVISTLVEIGIKKAFLHATDQAAMAALTATGVGSAATLSAAYAPAAAGAAIATAGGAAVAGGAALATTYGLAETLALAGVAHDGLDRVPREGTYLLQGGEMVLNEGNSRRLTQALERGAVGGGGETFVFAPTIQATDASGFDRLLKSRSGVIQSMMQQAFHRAGKRGPQG